MNEEICNFCDTVFDTSIGHTCRGNSVLPPKTFLKNLESKFEISEKTVTLGVENLFARGALENALASQQEDLARCLGNIASLQAALTKI